MTRIEMKYQGIPISLFYVVTNTLNAFRIVQVKYFHHCLSVVISSGCYSALKNTIIEY